MLVSMEPLTAIENESIPMSHGMATIRAVRLDSCRLNPK